MRHTILALHGAAAAIFTSVSVALAQTTGGAFSNGRGYLFLGIVLFVTCIIAAYYAYFRLYVARTNQYGVQEFSGAGDYFRQGLKRFVTGAVLVIWMLAALGMILVGIAS